MSMSEMDLEKMWGEAQVEDKADYGNMPDGKYHARIESLRYTQTKETGLPMFAWDLIVVGEKYNGRHIFHNRVLRDLDGVKWAKQELHNAGLDAANMNDAKALLGTLLDTVVEVQLKTKKGQNGEFQNVYINKVVQGSGDVFPDNALPEGW